MKALVSQRAVPDMGAVQDVSEFLSKSGYGSVSSCCCAAHHPSPWDNPMPDVSFVFYTKHLAMTQCYVSYDTVLC